MGLYAKAEKCEFHLDSVEYLGYVLSPSGLTMSDTNVKYGAEQEQSGRELSRITLEWMGFDNKMGNNLGLSSCAVPQSTVVCMVVYFRRTELLSGVSERSGIY